MKKVLKKSMKKSMTHNFSMSTEKKITTKFHQFVQILELYNRFLSLKKKVLIKWSELVSRKKKWVGNECNPDKFRTRIKHFYLCPAKVWFYYTIKPDLMHLLLINKKNSLNNLDGKFTPLKKKFISKNFPLQF